jgi:O-antigen/teichoic acid export membrane protein
MSVTEPLERPGADPSTPPPPSGTLAAIARIGGASWVSLCIGLLRGILYTRALSPHSRGIVSYSLLVASYLAYGPLAVYFSMEKQLPILLGEGKHEDAGRLERAGVTAVYVLSLLAAVGMCGAAAFLGRTSEMVRVSLVLGGLYLVFGQVSSIYRVVLRSRLQFGVIAASTIFEAVVLLVLIVSGAYLLDAPGALAGWAIGVGVLCLFLLGTGLLPGFARVDKPTAARLLRVGLPVLGVSLTGTLVRTTDNIIVVKYLGYEALGYYGLAWQLALYLYNLAGSADTVLTPKIFRAHGQGELAGVRSLVMRSTAAYAAFLPALAGVGALASAILLRVVLPEYVKAIPPMQVFFFTVTFTTLPMAARTVMVAANREFEMMAWDGFAAALIVAGVWYVVHDRPDVPLVHISLASGLGLLVNGYTITLRGLTILRVPPGQILRHAVALLLPMAYCLAAFVAALGTGRRMLPTDHLVARDIASLGVFAALVAPMVWWVERRLGVFRQFIADWRRRRG